MGEKQPEKGSQKPKGDPNMAIYSTYYENFFQKELLGDDNVATLKAKYDGAAPFEHTVIPNVFDIDLLKSVRKEISEHLHFTQKETDIYKIHQTGDLRNLSGLRKSELKRLYNLRTVRNSLYSREFREFISRVTGCGPLSVTRQDLAINVYQKGCYLLPHDDVIGTRRVSFILYLTDPKDVWEPSRGGALRLYPVQTLSDPSHEELVSIPPSFNHLALFAVQPGRSYHDVEEIYHDSPRLAISGWFHLPQSGEMDYDADVVEHAVEQSSLQQLNSKKHEADIPKISFNPFDENELDDILSEEEIDYLKDHLNPELLTPDAVEQLSNTFAEESTLRIYNFLNIPDSFAQEIVGIDKGSIKDSGFPVAGPLYKQKYCYATKDQPHCQAFHYVLGELFTHPAFRHWLKLACGVTPMSYSVQGRVFRKGSDYTLATAHEGSRPILEATLGLTPNDEGWGDGEFGGYEIYLSPDEDKKQDPAVFSHWRPKEKSQEDHILLTTGPSWNALTLVFREPEVLKFVKYCSKAAPGNRWDAVAQYHIANEDIEKDEEDETDSCRILLSKNIKNLTCGCRPTREVVNKVACWSKPEADWCAGLKVESRILTVVVARFRPQNATEVKENGGQQIVEFDSEDSVKIDSREARCSFTFDRVFDTHCRQGEVFDYSIKSTVEDILNGYNGTVFAYGQTGSGKSFTMMGPDIDDSALKGIVPRIVEQIFASILSSPDTIEYTVRVSYMEIYMERIRDLLNPANDNLPVHEEKNRGVYVKGLLEIYVSSVQEVYEVMRTGGMARAVAATNMNQESSRSHSIFVVNVTQKNLETGSAKSGQLFLVDLAGSEKVGKSGASGQTLEEAKKINKSLSALGMVINSLTDGKSTHIPYRDSKLTRILQESLGGNSRTTLIICCSPASYNDAETMSTLRFGTRAKSIRNKATINAEMSPAELKAQLKKAQARILVFETYAQSLEGELNSWRRGETIAADKWVTSNAVRGRSPVRIDKLEGGRSTPGLERDERDEFLKRENGLQDSLADREGKLLEHEAALQAARDEITTLRSRHIEKASDCERLAGEIEELRLQLQRVSFEEQEASIIMDSLRDSNAELTAQLEEVKASLANARIYSAEGTTKQKAERLADSLSGVEGMGEQVLEEVVDIVRTMEGIPATDKERLQSKLLSAQALWRRQDRDDQPPTELNMLKKSLMRDLQNRCERVVELEMSLDQAREQYHLLIKTSSTKTQQKRMTLLERNLEQLTHVQRQLVDQNSSLKKQVAIAERKLSARTERVCLLERKLNDNEEKLAAADHRFHAQFSAVKDRLEAAQRWKGPDMDGTAFANGLGRIAKPLRGGEKRASWFGR